MKLCFRCGEVKPIDDFYRHSQMSDGHLGKCKSCTKSDVRTHRKQNNAPREYDQRRYREDPVRRARILSDAKKRIAGNPEHRKIHTAVGHVLRDGRLKKPDRCPLCDATGIRIVGHHKDYSKPFDVDWMCDRCHARLHHAKD